MNRTLARALAAATVTLVGLGAGLTVAPAAHAASDDPTPSPAQARQMAEHGDFSLGALDVGEPQARYRTYGYYPGGMNGAEFAYCINPFNMGRCSQAKSAADDALAQAQQKFPGSTSLYLGKGDAFRHCYWSARMTIDMGAGEAQGFGDRHESDTPEGADKRMDLSNNATGRSVGQSYRSYGSASNRCQYLASHGLLVTLR